MSERTLACWVSEYRTWTGDASHLLELLLFARRDVDLGAVLHVRGRNHGTNAGPTTSDHGYHLRCQSRVRYVYTLMYSPIFPLTLKRFGTAKSSQHIQRIVLKTSDSLDGVSYLTWLRG